MKLRLFLVFVLIYITAVFGWWLYSFISYNEKEFRLEKSNLQLNAIVIQNRITAHLDKEHAASDSSPYATFKRKENEIREMHSGLNRSYGISTVLTVKDEKATLYNLFEVSTSPDELRAIHRKFIKKQRAFYSEVIFFTILVISGVVWVFNKLESLLNLNKMQNNFLLSVTHELKTPLTAIKLSSQILQQRRTDEETRMELTRQIVSNSDRLNELLDNVLLATRIDGKSYVYNMADTDLSSIIRKTAEQVLSAPNFTGTFSFDEPETIITGDEVSLRLVFSNLFQNAVKYAGKDCRVNVSFRREDGKLHVMVADNGPGLDPSEYKSVFNKFYRVGDENTRETKGTGLGLFLVRQILRSHKASIRAGAAEPAGTVFTITFKSEKL